MILFDEGRLMSIDPKMSYVSKEMAAGDPDFWTPKPPEAGRQVRIQSRRGETDRAVAGELHRTPTSRLSIRLRCEPRQAVFGPVHDVKEPGQ